MKIGITFDLKPKAPLPAGAPDDLHEEFDHPNTVKGIAEALRGLGHTPVELGNGREFLEKVLRDPPDFVFNIAEGHGTSRNREARVPAVCEMLDIPHTGSDVLTLALCLDKEACRKAVAAAGVIIPKGILLSPPAGQYDGDFHEFAGLVAELELALPLIAKPVCEGSSKGIRSKCLIEKVEDVGPTVVGLWNDYKQGVLLEEFIAGDEITVGLVGNDPPRVLGVMRVVPKQSPERFVYSLEVKRDWGDKVTYETPAQIAPQAFRDVEDAAVAAFDALECRDIARIDFRIRDGVPYFIEANPLPGLNPDWSDLVLLVKAMGMTYPTLIEQILTAAMERQPTSNFRPSE